MWLSSFGFFKWFVILTFFFVPSSWIVMALDSSSFEQICQDHRDGEAQELCFQKYDQFKEKELQSYLYASIGAIISSGIISSLLSIRKDNHEDGEGRKMEQESKE